MSIEINQDVLCEYCKNYHGNNMDGYEGSQCEKMEDRYLDEHSIIIKDADVKSFSKACVGDKFYHLNNDKQLPNITTGLITKIILEENGDIQFLFKSVGYNIIPKDDVSKTASGNYYLKQKECELALEKVCIKRILELSKIIRSINK